MSYNINDLISQQKSNELKDQLIEKENSWIKKLEKTLIIRSCFLKHLPRPVFVGESSRGGTGALFINFSKNEMVSCLTLCI